MNETLRIIANRYSCRDYMPTPVPDDILSAIALAAIEAPSAVNAQPWHIIMVRDKELIADLDDEGMARLSSSSDKTSYNRIKERGGKLFYGAPCMAVIAIDGSRHGAPLDCGIVCQNITLAAASLGIASVICGLAGLPFTGPNGCEFERRLGFPEGYKFGCAVLLGYAKTPKAPHEPDYRKISYIG